MWFAADNAAEWVADWYSASYYASSPAANPTGPATGTERVVRSASIYLGAAAANKRAAQRSHKIPTGSGAFDLNTVGFRCAK